VFDAFGIAVGRVMPAWLAQAPPAFSSSSGYPSSVIAESEVKKQKIRRPYGNGRMETVLLFAQAVYLTFSSVYVCKETVEHLLLSAGGQEGHHHHSGDEHPRDG
jgi:Co/Zn/Cd efflux system component